PAERQSRDDAPQHDRVDGALARGALHEADRLVGDHRRAGDGRVDGPEITHEALRAFAVPDVDGGMDLDQELTVPAYELPLRLRWQVLEADLLGCQVGLEALEAAEEVAIELLLQETQARLVGLTVARPQAQDEAVDGRAQMMEPRLGVAGRRF